MSPSGKARIGEGASVEGRSDCDQADSVCGEGIVTSDEWDEDYDQLDECEDNDLDAARATLRIALERTVHVG